MRQALGAEELKYLDTLPVLNHVAVLAYEIGSGQLSGRGISLVAQLCQTMEYAEGGTAVCAVYLLD